MLGHGRGGRLFCYCNSTLNITNDRLEEMKIFLKAPMDATEEELELAYEAADAVKRSRTHKVAAERLDIPVAELRRRMSLLPERKVEEARPEPEPEDEPEEEFVPVTDETETAGTVLVAKTEEATDVGS
jgi:hypothetical protein